MPTKYWKIPATAVRRAPRFARTDVSLFLK
jgi:hypothetical protein